MFPVAQNLSRYEAIFYGALALVLMAWILFENTLLYASKVKSTPASLQIVEDNVGLELGNRYLQLSDVRIPLTFVSDASLFPYNLYLSIDYCRLFLFVCLFLCFVF